MVPTGYLRSAYNVTIVMRIVVDGRTLSILPTGLALYTRYLLEHMARRCEHQWVVLLPGAPCVPLHGIPNLRVICSDWRRSRYFALWQQTVLPIQTTRARPDLFWSPHHYLPVLGRLPSVVTVHDLVWASCPEDMHVLRRMLERVMMPSSIRRATRVVAISQATEQDLYRHIEAARGKTRVIYSGPIDLPSARNGPDLAVRGIEIDRPYILFVGTRQPRKNLSRLVAAYRQLPDDLRANFALVIVGVKGWSDDTCWMNEDSSHAAGKIVVTGFVDNPVLARLYEQATAFALPSLLEGFGFPLLEAMACGIPVLTSNCSALPEVAGPAALTVDPRSVEAIREGLVRLLRDTDLRQRLSEAGKRRINEFDWTRTAEAMLEVFEDAHHSFRIGR